MPGPPRSSYLCPVTIGRTAEIERVHAFVAENRGTLLVSGEAGIGKSRLTREARTAAEQAGGLVIESRSYETDRSLPFAPGVTILRELARVHGLEEVARLAGPGATDLARLLPELRAGAKQPPAEEIDQETAKRRLVDALAQTIAAVAATTSLLVAVEDLHWVESSGLELLLHLARRARSDGYALVMTYRSDEINSDLAHVLAMLDRERLATEIGLQDLSARHVADMLQAIFRVADPAPASLLHMVYTLSEGNPFFVEEVLFALGVDRSFVTPGGTWNRGEPLPPRVPRSIHDAVRRRVDSLNEPAHQVLTLAAVAGRQFEFDLLSVVSGHDEDDLLEIMKELIAAQLVEEEPGDRFSFRHALTREAINAGMLDRERRRLHRRVAQAITQLSGGDPEERLDDLARHSFAAGSWAQALTASRRAAERATALHAPGAAVEHLGRAIEAAKALGLAPDAEIYRARGRALETMGEFERALADYQVALDLARASGARREEWQVLLDLALLWSSRDYAKTGALVKEALAAARALGDPAAIAHSLNRVGNWHCNVEESPQAAAFHREALAIFEELGDPRGTAETLDLLGISNLMGANLDAATAAYKRAESLWSELGDRRGLASALVGVGGMEYHNFHVITLPAARPDQTAREAVRRSLALSREMGWRAGESWALWSCEGMSYGACGEYDVALPATRKAIEIAQEIGHHQWLAAARGVLGRLHADLGDYLAARTELEAALSLARQINSPYWVRTAAAWLSSVLVNTGDLEQASAILDRELDPAIPMNTIAGRMLWLAAADLALARGDADQAIDYVDYLTAATPAETKRPVARLEHVRGQALVVAGRMDEAESSLLLARQAAIWSGARPLLWRIDASLARLYRLTKRRDEAISAAEAAWSLVDELKASVPDAALRDSLLLIAQRELPPRDAEAPPAGTTSPLSRRELEVAAHLTEGLTNREIGERLFLSEWTVATHVRNILAKLELSSRAQVAAWATAQGITVDD